MSAKHPPAFAPLETKNHRRGCVTLVTHTWQHNIREEPLLSYPTACAQRTFHWIHGFLGSVVPQRYTTELHAKCLNCLLWDPPQVRYWLDLGIGSGISKNPWNTKQGLRKRSLQGLHMAPCCSPDPSSTEQARAHTTLPSSKGLKMVVNCTTHNYQQPIGTGLQYVAGCQIANMEANTRKSEPLLSCRQHIPHRRGLWS